MPTSEQLESLISYRLRDLTANLIRVARGHGKPYDIVTQILELTDFLREYQASTGRWPDAGNLLGTINQYDAREDLHGHAQEMMISGALQVAASRLLRQTNIESQGRSEMFQGHRDLNEAHKSQR